MSLSFKLSKFTSFKQKQILMKTFLSLSLKLCEFMSCKQKRIVMKTFVESQFEVFYVYEFQTRANCHEDICWLSVSSYPGSWLSNKSEFSSRHLLSLSLKLFKFTSFKQKLILMKTFVAPQFEVMSVYEFHTKPISYESICWVSVLSYLRLFVLNKGESLRKYFLCPSLKLF